MVLVAIIAVIVTIVIVTIVIVTVVIVVSLARLAAESRDLLRDSRRISGRVRRGPGHDRRAALEFVRSVVRDRDRAAIVHRLGMAELRRLVAGLDTLGDFSAPTSMARPARARSRCPCTSWTRHARRCRSA